MTDSDKIAVVNIVINAIIAIIGWAIFIWATRKTIQATLQAAIPVAKPKRKRTLTLFERRMVRNLRIMQVCTIGIAVCEPGNYFLLNTLPPKSRFEWTNVALSILAMASMIGAAIGFQSEIRKVRSGEFTKRLKRLKQERKADRSTV